MLVLSSENEPYPSVLGNSWHHLNLMVFPTFQRGHNMNRLSPRNTVSYSEESCEVAWLAMALPSDVSGWSGVDFYRGHQIDINLPVIGELTTLFTSSKISHVCAGPSQYSMMSLFPALMP